MEKFDERKKSFEKKFAHDEELKFKVAAKRNKYLGQWASQKLGYDAEKEKEYIQAVIKADFQLSTSTAKGLSWHWRFSFSVSQLTDLLPWFSLLCALYLPD